MTAASTTDEAIQKKIFASGTTTLIFLSKDLNDIMKKVVKSLKGSSFLINGVSEKVENKVKEQKFFFLSMLAATMCCYIRLLWNRLAGRGVITAGEGLNRAGKDF